MEPTREHVVIARRGNQRVHYDTRPRLSATTKRELWLPLRNSSSNYLDEVGAPANAIVTSIDMSVPGIDKVDVSPYVLTVHFGAAFRAKEIDEAVRPILAACLEIHPSSIFDMNDLEDAMKRIEELKKSHTKEPPMVPDFSYWELRTFWLPWDRDHRTIFGKMSQQKQLYGDTSYESDWEDWVDFNTLTVDEDGLYYATEAQLAELKEIAAKNHRHAVLAWDEEEAAIDTLQTFIDTY